MFDELLRLLTDFGADDETRALAERLGQTITRNADGAIEIVEVEGVTPLTDDELDGLLAALMALADDDEASVALLTEAANSAEVIRDEQGRRTDAAEAEEAQLAAERARLRGETPEASEQPGEGGDGDGDGTEGGEEGDGAEGGDGTEGGEGDGDGAGEGEGAENRQPEPVSAGARPVARRQLNGRRPRNAAPAPGNTERAGRITVGADVPGFAAGAEVNTLADVDRAIGARLDAFRGGSRGGDGEHIAVATVHGNYPEDRRLTDDPIHNMRLIDAVLRAGLAPQAMAAAGGLCAPLTPFYGVEVMGTTQRPIRDALPSFQAARGGIISVEPPQLPAVSGATTVWTMEDDVDALDPEGPTKPCLVVDCGDQRTSEIQAIVSCLTWGNMRRRSFGEWDAAITQLAMVDQARVAETELWTQIQAELLALNDAPTVVSAYRDWLTVLITAVTNYRIRHRDENVRFRVLAPSQAVAVFTIDSLRGMAGGIGYQEVFRRTAADMQADAAAHGISITWSPDMVPVGPQAAATDLAHLPPTIPTAIFPEGTFLHLDDGTLDLGIVRDSVLNSRNNFQTFAETFEAVHHLGHEGYLIDVAVCPSGAVNGTLDPEALCASYT